MTGAAAIAPPHQPPWSAGMALIAGIIFACLTEAIAGTVLSLGRADIIGHTYATPDEFAWLDIGYTAAKLFGFVIAPWLMTRFDPRSLMLGATLTMGLASAVAMVSSWLDVLVVMRIVQGFAGGVLLVTGQAIVFLAYPKARQPLLQALFATGAVVAPATLAPALQGWLLDSQSWSWIFFSIVPLALAAAGLLLLADAPSLTMPARHAFDWIGASLIATALACLTYVLNQGSRWDWFEEPHIVWLTMLGAAALIGFIGRQWMAPRQRLLDFSVFANGDFFFAIFVSFVAGAALFGSAYLIPTFAVSVLALTPTDAGQLLLPSGAIFIGSLLIAALLFQLRRIPPVATVPFGILMIMTSMWLLSSPTRESGMDDMMPAILLRGLGLGFLFLSITLIAYSELPASKLASGIALFNSCRQFGGLMGAAWLQTMIAHDLTTNQTVLGANLTAGVPALATRLATTSAMLAEKGLDAATTARAALSLLGRAVTAEANVIAFGAAFYAIAALFVVAVPVLIVIKIALVRYAKARAMRDAAKAGAASPAAQLASEVAGTKFSAKPSMQ